VVAERDRVDAGVEDLLRVLGRDAEAAGRVLAVDDHEGQGVALAQGRQAVQQRVPADPADDVPDEQDPGGGRLALSHTLRMVGGH
jgi:hypothetical protein